MIQNSQATTSLHYNRTLTFLFVILSLIASLGTLIYFIVSDCSQNCKSYEGNRKPCLNEGSLYCCEVSQAYFFSQECTINNGCILDNSSCGRLIVSSAVIGGLILISTVAIIIMALRTNKPEKDQKKNTHLKVPLLRDDSKEKINREDQTTSSSIVSINDVTDLENQEEIK